MNLDPDDRTLALVHGELNLGDRFADPVQAGCKPLRSQCAGELLKDVITRLVRPAITGKANADGVVFDRAPILPVARRRCADPKADEDTENDAAPS